ncbi:MAG: ROK family transcriptional regulator [Candidatus Cryptobacteroides sp.]
MGVSFLNNIDGKNSAIKQRILGLCITEGDYSIADLSKELNSSIPTITKLVGELINEGYLEDMGKQGTNGGRRPSIYGLNPSAGYFVGVDIRRDDLSIAVTNFKGQTILSQEDTDYTLEATEESFRGLCDLIINYLKSAKIDTDKVNAYGINLTGRVNNKTGYSFSYFIGEDRPLSSVLEEMLGAPVFVENDSRAMTYGEYICGVANNEKDMLFLNVSWGLGMGMIIDGKLSYGKSGFSGEIGHFPLLDNDRMCQCGKVGCLETGASGLALHRNFIEKLKEGRTSLLSEKYNAGEEITLDDIIDAVLEEDVLAIETVEEVGFILGRAIAGLINIFNPELVVIGGKLAAAKDYLMIPIKGSINKHSLNIVNKDTTIKFSKLGKKAGPLGACMLSRSKLLGLM